MSKLKDGFGNLINRILGRRNMLAAPRVNVSNYEEYRETYDTLAQISSKIESLDAYLVGGISAAIKTGNELYRQNDDLDIMCNFADLEKLIAGLEEARICS